MKRSIDDTSNYSEYMNDADYRRLRLQRMLEHQQQHNQHQQTPASAVGARRMTNMDANTGNINSAVASNRNNNNGGGRDEKPPPSRRYHHGALDDGNKIRGSSSSWASSNCFDDEDTLQLLRQRQRDMGNLMCLQHKYGNKFHHNHSTRRRKT